MNPANPIKDELREFILSTCLPGEPPDTLRDDTPLQTSGILDSLAALGLVTFIEERFGIKLDLNDTSVERFDRLDDIAMLIARKKAETARPPETAG